MKPLACKTVMVVDDSPIVRERLISLLSEIEGVQVVGEADMAQTAIEAIPRLKPGVVILDISMPGGSGLLVLDALKKLDPAPLVIVLTNYAYDLYRKKCLNAGADYFFDKSTEFEDLKFLLERVQREGEVMPAAVSEPIK